MHLSYDRVSKIPAVGNQSVNHSAYNSINCCSPPSALESQRMCVQCFYFCFRSNRGLKSLISSGIQPFKPPDTYNQTALGI